MKAAEDCFLKVKRDYLKYLSREKVFQSKNNKIKSLKKIYIPISFWIENKYKNKGKTLFLSFSGGQGSGKTTVTGILKIIFKMPVTVVFPEPCPPENPKNNVLPFFLYLFSIQKDIGIYVVFRLFILKALDLP